METESFGRKIYIDIEALAFFLVNVAFPAEDKVIKMLNVIGKRL